MIEHTTKERVDAPPTKLWDEFCRPDRLERIIPSVEDIEQVGDGTYHATLHIEIIGSEFPVKLETTARNRPNRLQIESARYGFVLEATLQGREDGEETDVRIRAEMDPPVGEGVIGGRFQDELEQRMDKQMQELKSRV